MPHAILLSILLSAASAKRISRESQSLASASLGGGVAHAESSPMDKRVARTPDSSFEGIQGFPFKPKYKDVPARFAKDLKLRMHYVDEGPRDATETLLFMHGEPEWSYTYRHMIPLSTEAGYRALAPDLIGFGKSDKPTQRSSYNIANHVRWVESWLNQVNATRITLFVHDWGGIIGLRLLAEFPDYFARVVITNTPGPVAGKMPAVIDAPLRRSYAELPAPSMAEVVDAFRDPKKNFALNFQSGVNMLKMMVLRNPSYFEAPAFLYWIKHAAESPEFRPEATVKFLAKDTPDYALEAFAAPFPKDDAEKYLTCARLFPALIPFLRSGGFGGSKADADGNAAAWKFLEGFQKPVVVAFSNDDTSATAFVKDFQTKIPGATCMNHTTIQGGGHFTPETRPDELFKVIQDLIANTPKPESWHC